MPPSGCVTMPGSAAEYVDLAGHGLEDSAEGGIVLGAGNGRPPNRSMAASTRPGSLLQQERPGGAAQLPHHGGGAEVVPDAVPDDDRDPAVWQADDVVPVTAYLEGAGGGLVAGAEARRELVRAEDRPLQREVGLALLVDQVRPVDRLAELAADEAEQGLVLHGQRAVSTARSIQIVSVPDGCSSVMP